MSYSILLFCRNVQITLYRISHSNRPLYGFSKIRKCPLSIVEYQSGRVSQQARCRVRLIHPRFVRRSVTLLRLVLLRLLLGKYVPKKLRNGMLWSPFPPLSLNLLPSGGRSRLLHALGSSCLLVNLCSSSLRAWLENETRLLESHLLTQDLFHLRYIHLLLDWQLLRHPIKIHLVILPFVWPPIYEERVVFFAENLLSFL